MDVAWHNHDLADGNVGTETLTKLDKIVEATWMPIRIRFLETRTPEPKKGPAGQKISSDKKLMKIKVEGS